MSILVMTVSLTPALAPFLDGWIQHLSGWVSIFIVLFIYCFLITALMWWKLPETKQISEQTTPIMCTIGSSAKILLTHRYYLLTVIIPAAGYLFGNFLNTRLTSRVTTGQLILSGLTLLLAFACGITLMGLLGGGLLTSAVILFIFFFVLRKQIHKV